MRAFIRNTIAAERARREENGQGGFSLIELIIVVVILGILAAVAIPIFLNMQSDAKQNTVDTVAANGATQAAVAIASGEATTVGDLDFSNLNSDDVTVTATIGTATEPLDTLCVRATGNGNLSGFNGQSGPGC